MSDSVASASQSIRLATMDDVPGLESFIPTSVRGLSHQVYSQEQIESAIRFVFGVDTQLIVDQTYYVVQIDAAIAGCGGWSKRRSLCGADKMKSESDPLLDPAIDAARIRAFFVRPEFARMGVGSMIITRAIVDARDAGYRRLELMATLPGVPLYAKHGFSSIDKVTDVLPDGVRIPLVRMGRSI